MPSDLDLFLLALISSGLGTSYELKSRARISLGTTLPALNRLSRDGLIKANDIIELVPEPASTMIAVGGFAALRLGEIRGFDVRHYDHDTIYVKQSAWRSHLKDTKTKASKAPVPVIAQLGARIDAHMERMGSPSSGLLFPNGSASRSMFNAWLRK